MLNGKRDLIDQPPAPQSVKSRWPELSSLILIGLVLGVGCGLFFGDYCEPLTVVGTAFIGMLRMTVLPYIAITLIANLGRLSYGETRRLAWIGGLVLVVLWSAALATVWLLPTAFPKWSTGSFFSTLLITSPKAADLFSLFIPTNIFASLAENQVPAVVIFCMCIGLALATTTDRATLIAQLDVMSRVLVRVNSFIIQFAPVGVFAIAASTTGTLSWDEVIRLQAYLMAYTAGALFLGFFVLPLLVTTTTTLTYRQVMRVAKDPMVTAFATGKLIVVIPMLIQNTERLMEELRPVESSDDTPAIDVLYTIVYPFPHVGKLLSMVFIPFAAWFLGSSIAWDEYPGFLTSGLFSFFGGPIVAIPFLLDQMQLPHDMFQLFLLSGVYGERLGDALGAMHLATFSLIATHAFRRSTFRITRMSVLKYIAAVVLVGGLMLTGMRVALLQSIGTIETKNDVIKVLQLLDEPVKHAVVPTPVPNPEPLHDGETLLQRIRRRGIIRVGYNEDKLPFAFLNEAGELVGLDINLAHAFARDIGVEIEFVRFSRDTLGEQLQADHFDIVMSGLVGTLERSEQMRHTDSYMEVNLAFVVSDFQARRFRTLESIRRMDQVQIGFVDLSRGFVERVRESLPKAKLVEIRSNRDFFHGTFENLDALLISAESGSAFTLIYPEFEVVVPTDLRVKLPLFYAIGKQDAEMQDFLEHWISLRKLDGTTQAYYDYWVLGKTKNGHAGRWSVIRDVLHWVD